MIKDIYIGIDDFKPVGIMNDSPWRRILEIFQNSSLYFQQRRQGKARCSNLAQVKKIFITISVTQLDSYAPTRFHTSHLPWIPWSVQD